MVNPAARKTAYGRNSLAIIPDAEMQLLQDMLAQNDLDVAFATSNFAVGTIFIDAFLKLCRTELAETEPIVKVLVELAAKHDVDFVLSLSADPEEIPVFFKQYLI